MNKLSIWLTGVILLTITAFLVVFKPITFSPRKDPSDVSRYLAPWETQKDWEPSIPPEPFTSFGDKVDLYVYKPQHDLRLGLDLRGGMRVVLQIPDRAEFVYSLKPALHTSLEAARKQQALIDLLMKPDYLGDPALIGDVEDSGNLRVVVSEDQVKVVTMARTKARAQAQYDRVDKAMSTIFGDGKFEAPDRDEVFKPVDEAMQSSVIATMENRLNGTGLSEMTSYAKGSDQVVLEIPGVKDVNRVRDMIGDTAQMDFYLLPADVQVDVDDERNTVITRGGRELTHEEVIKESYLGAPGSALDPDEVKYTLDTRGQPAVNFGMATKEDQRKFASLTGSNIGRHLAIVLDDQIISAPVIESQIFGSGIIQGNFDKEEAQDLIVKLRSGALPVPLDIAEERTVSATLGETSVSASLIAGLVGLAAVLLFMFAYYRLPGLMANFALVIYVFLSLMVLKFFDATLTLPGIAGIIISIGMAVDANVIIFERLKEELRMQKPLETAIDVAFSRAWTAILDSNIASLITGGILWWLGTGAVRGFAVTLVIGVAVSLFTAISVTRLFMKLMIRTKIGKQLAWYGV